MPAQVRAVEAAEGDQVEKGQTLLLLEAMKMEIRIKAPSSGKVKRMLVKTGQTVDRNEILAEIGEA
jgi:biotin carboxyl carrier protein